MQYIQEWYCARSEYDLDKGSEVYYIFTSASLDKGIVLHILYNPHNRKPPRRYFVEPTPSPKNYG
jgi:hypothetical protein